MEQNARSAVRAVYTSDSGVSTLSGQARITLFTSSQAPLCKRFSLINGEIKKEAFASFYDGDARTVVVPTATALNNLLNGLTTQQAVSTGALSVASPTRITTSAKAGDGGVARTLENFTFPTAPGWLLWDYDDKTMPPEVRARVEALGGPLAALYHLWPEAKGATCVIRPSSSDGISAPNVEGINSAGLHGFFLVADVSRTREILETLERKAWAEGLAWIALSRSGAKLRRSIVDTAVGSPERLIFEAAPILQAPVIRLASVPLVREGYALQGPQMAPDLLAMAQKAEADARRDIEPEAERVEAVYVEDRARIDAKKTGAPLDQTRARIRRMMRGAVLGDDHLLQLKDGQFVRVGDILDNSDTWHRVSLPDPIEGLAYGSDKATLLLKPRTEYPDEKPRLISHAHGVNTVYRFVRHMTQAELEAAESSAERVTLPAAANLPDGKEVTMKEALIGADTESALTIAVAVAHKLQLRVPHRMDVDQVMVFIMDSLPDDVLSTAEAAAVRGRIEWLVSKRKASVLDRTALPVNAWENHDVLRVDNLDELEFDGFLGVTLLKSPMGSGKTQKGGKPFIMQARAAGESTMALCHRITLTTELSRRMGLPHYQTALVAEMQKNGVASCVPSILAPPVAEAMAAPEAVFIDEIVQVLQFLANPMCAAGHGDNRDVYNRLIQIVRQAKRVLVADANLDARTIAILEMARPGERFRIVEMPPQPTEKRATAFDAADPVLDYIAVELAADGKVWLACEGQKKAEALAEHFRNRGHRVMCVTARTKLDGDVAAFLGDAETASRNYDLVVSSPAISSGLSIEHRESEHFTLGAFIGAGSAIAPEDAMQQLGRVRYLRRFLIGLEISNLSGGVKAEAIMRGVLDAAELEGAQTGWGNFDTFAARSEAEAHNARDGFSAGLWWLLEREGWTLERGGSVRSGIMANAQAAYCDARKAALIAAEPLTKHQADLLRRTSLDLAQADRLMAHLMRVEFGKRKLTAEDVKLWDDGRAKEVRERFEDLTAASVDLPSEDYKALTARGFRTARRKLYADLFDGFDITKPLGEDECNVILDRVMEKPEACAAVGIVGQKYRAQWTGKGGVLKPVQRPKRAGAEVAKILRQCGLVIVAKRRRKCSVSAPLSILREAQTEQDSPLEYARAVTQQSRDQMAEWLARRAAFDVDAEMTAFIVADDAATPPDRHNNEKKQGEVVPEADMHWERARRRAQKRREVYRRTMADKEWRDKVGHDVPAGHGVELPSPIPGPEIRRTLAPRPARCLIVVPVPEQIAARLSCPLSHYVVGPDGPCLLWIAEMSDVVAEVFADWFRRVERDPDAWA